jgi:hypothetical protein
MIPKSASRFSEKITLEQKVATGFEPDGIGQVHPPTLQNREKTKARHDRQQH